VTALIFIAAVMIGRLLFDCAAPRDKLLAESAFYITKELGKFYKTDAAGAVFALTKELRSAVDGQTKVLAESVDKMTKEIKKSLDSAADSIAKSSEEAVAKMVTAARESAEAMSGWADTLRQAGEAQKSLNEGTIAIDKLLGDTAAKFMASINSAGEGFGFFSEKAKEYADKLDGEVTRLTGAVAELKDVAAKSMLHTETAAATLALVKTNQTALEESLTKYENSLSALTGEMGGAIGRMTDIHVQSSVNALNDSLKDNIAMITSSNAELLHRLTGLFNELQETSKRTSATLITIKEQLDGSQKTGGGQ